jgi:hypothetical protein
VNLILAVSLNDSLALYVCMCNISCSLSMQYQSLVAGCGFAGVEEVLLIRAAAGEHPLARVRQTQNAGEERIIQYFVPHLVIVICNLARRSGGGGT